MKRLLALVLGSALILAGCGSSDSEQLAAYHPAEVEYLRKAQRAAGAVFSDEVEGLELGLSYWKECRALLDVHQHIETTGAVPTSGGAIEILRQSTMWDFHEFVLSRARDGDAAELVHYLFHSDGGCKDTPLDPASPEGAKIGDGHA